MCPLPITVHVRGQANFEHCHEPDEQELKETFFFVFFINYNHIS